jgi:hypothetical protein
VKSGEKSGEGGVKEGSEDERVGRVGRDGREVRDEEEKELGGGESAEVPRASFGDADSVW